MDTINLEVVTFEREIFQHLVEYIDIPTQSGPLTIKHNHAPIVTSLLPGVLRYMMDKEEHFIVISAGFMEVNNNTIEILVHHAEKVEEIDLERALQAKLRAEKRLAESTADIDTIRAEAALARANLRLMAKHKDKH